jgi:GNAT superfamily N-acetyltransferase
MTARVRVVAAGPDDWRVVRHLRLGALADAPDAFGSTLEEEAPQPEDFWRGRLARPDATTLLASWVGDDGEARPAGLVTVLPDFDDRVGVAVVVGVWVAPSARGRGVGDALLGAVIDRARQAGFTRLVLDVGDGNAPARGLYARHGFVPTGRTGTLPPPRTHMIEHELARDLG